MLFAGYGHFTDVIRDLPEFSSIGANLIQIEIGPSSIFPKEGKNGEFSEPDFSDLENRILPALRSAAEHNVKVCLLLSPHYHPAWLLDKYPDMRADSDFLKYEITHPKAEEMLDAYLAALIPKLKASPWSAALHSLVLSNEPVYIGCTPYNPQSLKDFRHYLKQKYGTPSDFNAAAQRDYPDFDSMTGQIETDPALRSEFERFRRDTFAAWHRRLAERVRRIWPEIPLHAKMMIFSSLYVPQATDAGMFAAFSDYNGNDNYRMYDFDNAGWRLTISAANSAANCSCRRESCQSAIRRTTSSPTAKPARCRTATSIRLCSNSTPPHLGPDHLGLDRHRLPEIAEQLPDVLREHPQPPRQHHRPRTRHARREPGRPRTRPLFPL